MILDLLLFACLALLLYIAVVESELAFGLILDGPVSQRQAHVLNEVSNKGSTPFRSIKLRAEGVPLRKRGSSLHKSLLTLLRCFSHSVAINRWRPSEALSSVVIHKNASGRGDLSGIPLSGNRCAECGGPWSVNCVDLYLCDKCFLAGASRQASIDSGSLPLDVVPATPNDDGTASVLRSASHSLSASSPSTRFCQMPGSVAYSVPRPSTRREQHETRRRILRKLVQRLAVQGAIEKI